MADWTMIRVKGRTRDRLRQFLASQEALAELGRVDLAESGRPGGGPPSVDWLLNHLLDRVDAHRQRAKRASRKKGCGA